MELWSNVKASTPHPDILKNNKLGKADKPEKSTTLITTPEMSKDFSEENSCILSSEGGALRSLLWKKLMIGLIDKVKLRSCGNPCRLSKAMLVNRLEVRSRYNKFGRCTGETSMSLEKVKAKFTSMELFLKSSSVM